MQVLPFAFLNILPAPFKKMLMPQYQRHLHFITVGTLVLKPQTNSLVLDSFNKVDYEFHALAGPRAPLGLVQSVMAR